MNSTLSRVVVFLAAALAALATDAFAYSIKYNSGKTQATIYCDNGDVAGTLYWNGSAWSNGRGLRGADVDELARKLVDTSGKQCK
jgi:hypothetical protein